MALAEVVAARADGLEHVDGQRLVVHLDGLEQLPVPADELGDQHDLGERAAEPEVHVADVVVEVGAQLHGELGDLVGLHAGLGVDDLRVGVAAEPPVGDVQPLGHLDFHRVRADELG